MSMGPTGGLVHPLDLLVGLAPLGCSRTSRATTTIMHLDGHFNLIVHASVLISKEKYLDGVYIYIYICEKKKFKLKL